MKGRQMDFVTPPGFRDVLADEATARERIARAVQDGFAARGYVPIETPTLENMQVMQVGGRLPRTPFKFFDAKGDLVTLRPDVTLQVARMCATRLGNQPGPFRFRYMQRIFREAEGQLKADVREKTQIGIECIGEKGPEIDAEVVELFASALATAGVRSFKLSLATVGVLRALLAASGATDAWCARVLEAFHASNFVALDRLCGAGPDGRADELCEGAAAPVFADAIRALARIRGGREAIDAVRALVAPLGCEDGLADFARTYDLLAADGLADNLLVDFSVMSSFDYYTGIVFEAFAPDLGTPLGSGGRYDNMLGSYGEDRPAAGFAFTLEEAMAAAANDEAEQDASVAAGGEEEAPAPAASASAPASPAARPLRIAVPKGSLNPDAVAALTEAGLDTEGLDDPGRQLIIRRPGVEYIIVRPSDAPVFVEMGAADCGICGEDSLLEKAADVVELTDLRFGGCRFVVAERAGAREAVKERYRKLGALRVTTKYPRITAAHFARRGTQVELVKLNGNIELGPLTGLADCIVDITATGRTLRENNLVVVDEVLSSTARFFANVCSFRTDDRVRELADRLGKQVAGQDLKVTAGGSVQEREDR